jgi:hypothetical protein
MKARIRANLHRGLMRNVVLYWLQVLKQQSRRKYANELP